MKTRIFEVTEHSFRFLLKGYKNLKFYVSDAFEDEDFLYPLRYVLVQREDGAEMLAEVPDVFLVKNHGFTEDEVNLILGAISRKAGMYYHAFEQE